MIPHGLIPEEIFTRVCFPNSPADERAWEPCESVSAAFLITDCCELEAGHRGDHQATRRDGTVVRWGDRVDYPSRERRRA